MRTARQNDPMSDSEVVKFLAGGEDTLPMELAEENCHAESVAGLKGSSASPTKLGKPATIPCLYWAINLIFEFPRLGLKVV